MPAQLLTVSDIGSIVAPLSSPALTGTPTAPTAATANNTTQLATTAFVQQELLAGGATARALVVSVRNQSGATMTAGTVVYVNGSTGNLPTIAKAIATSDATSAQTLGLVQTSIANNGTGLVVVRGILGNLNTSTLTEGQQLYLSPTTAGAYTTTKQYAPNHLVYIGIVTRAHPTLGSIEVAVQNGFEMDELHNVSAQSPANGDTLRWNAATSLWEKSALGTLATQSGTFSGTSSGTNTGDQTALTVANTPAGGIAATTVQAAINELDTEKANLASPTFTGNPLAPTPATTDNDTSIATTAMVQAVANAQWTQPTALAITTAGNSNVAAETAQNRYLTQRVNVTAFTGTATVTLQNTSAIAGDKRRLIVAMPAGFANLVELRNLTSGGTLLATVPMDGALARTWLGYSTFDGTNWGVVSFSPMSVDEFVMARAAFRTDYVNSDGATTNRAAGIYGPFDAVNNPREYVAGAASLTDFIQWTVPTVNPSADILLVSRGSSSTGNYPWAASNAMAVWMDSSGNLTIAANGATWATNNRQFIYSGFRAAYSGRNGLISFYLTTGTSNPVVKFNGVDISSSFSVSNGASPVNWLDSAMVPTYRHAGYLWPAGPAPIVTPILGATSAADDAFYMATGKWPAWVVAGGSCVTPLNTNPTFATNPTLDAFAWTLDSGVTYNAAGTVDFATGGGGGFMRASTNGALPYRLNGQDKSLRIVATITNYVSGTVKVARDDGGSFTVLRGSDSISANGVIDIDVIAPAGYPSTRVMVGSLIGVTASVDSLYIYKNGALSLPSVQPINVIDDVSGIGGNQGRLLGCTAVTDKTNWRISANTWTSGNQQILAGSILDSTKDVIDLVEQSTTGTPTTTIGSVSAGSQYKSSSTLTAGINPVTLVTRKLASNDIWVNSSSTAVVRTNIVGHRTN